MSEETTPYSPAAEDTHQTGKPAPRVADPGDPFPDEFQLVRKLGDGAFGDVWLAEDLSPLGRLVALKFLRTGGRPAGPALASLQNEARLLAALRHPNLVAVHAWRTVPGSGAPCLVMQYVPGGSLDRRVEQDGPLPWALAARYVADIAD